MRVQQTVALACAGVLFSACAATSVQSVSAQWEFEPPPANNPRWLIIAPSADGPSKVEIQWPYGLGCQEEIGEFRDRAVTVEGSRFPAVVQFHNRRKATLHFRYADGTTQTFALRRKTHNATFVFCE
jgi:hypothetical protein